MTNKTELQLAELAKVAAERATYDMCFSMNEDLTIDLLVYAWCPLESVEYTTSTIKDIHSKAETLAILKDAIASRDIVKLLAHVKDVTKIDSLLFGESMGQFAGFSEPYEAIMESLVMKKPHVTKAILRFDQEHGQSIDIAIEGDKPTIDQVIWEFATECRDKECSLTGPDSDGWLTVTGGPNFQSHQFRSASESLVRGTGCDATVHHSFDEMDCEHISAVSFCMTASQQRKLARHFAAHRSE